MNIWRHLRAILILPVMVTLVIPAGLIFLTGQFAVGWGLTFPLSLVPAIVGCALIGPGLALLIKTASQFAAIGRGTLAPWDPTQALVVEGVYRHVRNPMISGVLSVLLGEAVLLGSWPLLGWFLLFFLLNGLYIPLVEEPALIDRFDGDYLVYKQNVPRWIPRLTSWTPTSTNQVCDRDKI
ncbi:MAG: isoprenylcysteine carboxylmethyltransferase family protein [Anaerolineae bacterium]|nr:isoprenylcysteine carboxylmethyltransferase family protein [Anaerolineae bacterium]